LRLSSLIDLDTVLRPYVLTRQRSEGSDLGGIGLTITHSIGRWVNTRTNEDLRFRPILHDRVLKAI
jgi:hypothetical protein